MMLKLCKNFGIFWVSFFYLCGIFACGKWYTHDPVAGPLLEGKEVVERKVSAGLRDGRNVLCDEKTGNFYINNFFPHLDAEERQLGDIFEDKGFLGSEDLARIKQLSSRGFLSSITLSSFHPDEYIASLVNFINAAITYLSLLGIPGTVEILEEIRGTQIGEPSKWNVQILRNLVTALKTRSRMEPVWNYMHAERLLFFDKYYDSESKTSIIPSEPLVFVSYFDMCDSCENFMTDGLAGMESCPSEKFSKPPLGERDYKILVGSFTACGTSRKRDRESELLKVILDFSEPERTRRR